MSNSIITSNVFRQCAVQKKLFPRKELFRLVRTKRGNVFFDPEYKIFGRGIHFHRDLQTVEKFFHPKKRGMLSHFLKMNIPPERFEELKKEVELFFAE
jgi:predicted RNA-binding protein YlxR (DUF448 family)